MMGGVGGSGIVLALLRLVQSWAKANYSGFRKERIMRLLAWRLLYPFLSPSVVVFVISMPQFDSDAQSLRVGSSGHVAGGLSHG